MDLQILYNNPVKKKGNPMKKKKNPRLVYKKAPPKQVKMRDGTFKTFEAKGPTYKFGKINWPTKAEREKDQDKFLEAALVVGDIKDPVKMKKAYDKVKKLQTNFEKQLEKRQQRVEKEIEKMAEKGYDYDKDGTIKEAKKELAAEQKAIKQGKAAIAKVERDISKILSRVDGGKEKKKKKKVSKKARKKSSRKGRKSSKKVGYKRKRNPIKVFDNPVDVDIMENPRRKSKTAKKARRKKARRKVAKKVAKKTTKKSTKKKVRKSRKGKGKGRKSKNKGILEALFDGKPMKKKKKKASKKKATKKKATKKKASKRKGRRKSVSKKAVTAMKTPKYKKKKHTRRKNPISIQAIKEKLMKPFGKDSLTNHELGEAVGLLSGGALLKIYDHAVKKQYISPLIAKVVSPTNALFPVVDALADVLLAVGAGHLAGMLPNVGQDAKKGIIGAAVVQLGIKTMASVSTAVGMPMNGIIGVPSMSGIIGVPSMNGIIGVPSMGAMSADFQGLGAQGMQNSDFGAYKTVGLEGSYLQAADYDSGSVIPTAPRTPEAFSGFGAYENVEYSDEGEDGDF